MPRAATRSKKGLFEIRVRTHFSAAHHLRGYPGACANPHGHNWEIEVAMRGRTLDRTGFLIDFQDVRRGVRDVLAQLDHADLNVLPDFAAENPTSEHIARHLYRALARRLDGAGRRVCRVTVCETPGAQASYTEE